MRNTAFDDEDGNEARRLQDIGNEFAAGESPRQRQLAEDIYAQLKAGAGVDDVKHLIGQLSQAATEAAAGRKRRGDRV